MSQNYPWYEVVSGPVLEQGDLLKECPIIMPARQLTFPLADNTELFNVWTYDVVVMTQSCDLVNDKVEDVVLCPHWSLSDAERMDEYLRSRKAKEAVRRGNQSAYHMLAACEREDLKLDIRIVDFHRVFSLPKSFLSQFAANQGKRLRLLPPYREHLSQAFARFFMRVGLPTDIPPF